jgi:hypothetical protein
VGKDPDNPDHRDLASTKCNLAKLPRSLAYALDTAPNGALRIGWIGPSSHTAESLLAVPPDDEDRNAIQDAVETLRAMQCNRMVSVDEVKREARKAGISERTLYRAKAILKVESKLIGFGKDGKWFWSLPQGTAEAPRDCHRLEPLVVGKKRLMETNVATLERWNENGGLGPGRDQKGLAPIVVVPFQDVILIYFPVRIGPKGRQDSALPDLPKPTE